MNKFSKLLITAILLAQSLYGQLPHNKQPNFLKANSNWAFGLKSGLSFNAPTPGAFATGMDANEGCASASDPNTGELMFYSNGEQCWDADHNIMQNGDSLLGNSKFSGSQSASQGVLIAPVLGKEKQYYLFSLLAASPTAHERLAASGCLFYSVIDMSLNNGLGGIVPGQKNIPLTTDTLSEAMTAVPGNICDIWLLVLSKHKPELYAYHITHQGINKVPIVSTLGAPQVIPTTIASVNVSPDRTKLAVFSGLEGYVGEFDASSGLFSNRIDLNATKRGASSAFSPDNSKLYVADANNIQQFDLTTFNTASINGSMQSIPLSKAYQYNTFRLYNDTIYFVTPLAGHNHISRINKPNLSGTACELDEYAITVATFRSTLMLGNDVVFPLIDTLYNVTDTFVCRSQDDGAYTLSTLHHIEDAKYLWSTGDTTAAISIAQEGKQTIWVSYGDFCNRHIDTIHIGIEVLSTTVTINNFELGTTGGPFKKYQWLLNGQPIPGATQPECKIQENGDYAVIITGENGCTDTSDAYSVNNFSNISPIAAMAQHIHIYPNPAHDVCYIDAAKPVNVSIADIMGRKIAMQHQTTKLHLNGYAPGIYMMTITDADGTLLKVEKLIKQN